jgi:hypothetical protein
VTPTAIGQQLDPVEMVLDCATDDVRRRTA